MSLSKQKKFVSFIYEFTPTKYYFPLRLIIFRKNDLEESFNFIGVARDDPSSLDEISVKYEKRTIKAEDIPGILVLSLDDRRQTEENRRAGKLCNGRFAKRIGELPPSSAPATVTDRTNRETSRAESGKRRSLRNTKRPIKISIYTQKSAGNLDEESS